MTKWQKRLYKKYAKCVFYTHFALLIHKRHNFVICDMSQWQYADRLNVYIVGVAIDQLLLRTSVASQHNNSIDQPNCDDEKNG